MTCFPEYTVKSETDDIGTCESNGCHWCDRHPDNRPEDVSPREWAEQHDYCRFSTAVLAGECSETGGRR